MRLATGMPQLLATRNMRHSGRLSAQVIDLICRLRRGFVLRLRVEMA